MLLQRKSMLGVMMSKRQSKQAPNKVREILTRQRSSLTDMKSTFQYFKSFKLVEQICQRNVNSFRQFFDQLSYESFTPNSVICDTRQARDKRTWLIASGEVLVTNAAEEAESVTLGEFSGFGYEGCGEQEMWEHYVAKAVNNCVVFCIPSSRVAKLLGNDTLSQEAFKRNFICSSLNIPNEGSFCKSLIKKFTLKQFPKSSVLFEEGSKFDTFMLIKKGNIELSKMISDYRGRNRVKIGTIGEGSYIGEVKSFKEQKALNECTAETITHVQVYSIGKNDLLKYFSQITDLQAQLIKITEQKCSLRDRLVNNYLDNQDQQPEESAPEMISPLFRKSASGFRQKRQNTVSHRFVGPAKYDQMVANQEKVWVPLSSIKPKHRYRPKTRIRLQQINKMLKEEKINKIMVKQLIHKRVRGIPDDQIKIQLKPTIFTQKLSGQFDNEMFKELQNFSKINTQDQNHRHHLNLKHLHPHSQSAGASRFESQRHIHPQQTISDSYCPLGNADTGLINELSKSVLDYKKNVHCLKLRPEKKQRIGKSSGDFSRIVRQKMKEKTYYEYVKPPREAFQCELNSAGDIYVLTQSSTGRPLRKRIRMN